jgi:hypothetical protein
MSLCVLLLTCGMTGREPAGAHLQEWAQALSQPIQQQKLQELLQVAETAQKQAQDRVLALSFLQVDDAGGQIRQSPSEVALHLHLPEERCTCC